MTSKLTPSNIRLANASRAFVRAALGGLDLWFALPLMSQRLQSSNAVQPSLPLSAYEGSMPPGGSCVQT